MSPKQVLAGEFCPIFYRLLRCSHAPRGTQAPTGSDMKVDDILANPESFVGQSLAIDGEFFGDRKSGNCIIVIPPIGQLGYPVRGIPIIANGLMRLLDTRSYAGYLRRTPGGRYSMRAKATLAGTIVAVSDPSDICDITSLTSTIAVADLTSLVFHIRDRDISVALGDIGSNHSD